MNALEFIQREIEASALSYHERYKTGQDIVVGVNKYVTDTVDDVDILRVDPESERRQLERLAKFKADRDQQAVAARLEELREVAARRRQPPAPDPRRARRPRLDRRGLRGDAGRVRRVPGRGVLLGRGAGRALQSVERRQEWGRGRGSPPPWNRRPSARWSNRRPSSGSSPTTWPGWSRGWAAWSAPRSRSRSRSPRATRAEPRLARRPRPSPVGRIALELAESGFGTAVGITAEHARPEPERGRGRARGPAR